MVRLSVARRSCSIVLRLIRLAAANKAVEFEATCGCLVVVKPCVQTIDRRPSRSCFGVSDLWAQNSARSTHAAMAS